MAHFQSSGYHGSSHSNQQTQWTRMYQQQPPVASSAYKPASDAHTFEVDNEDVPEYRRQTFAQKHFGGLKRTLRAFLVTACIILAMSDGLGDCGPVKRLNTWFHLAINILSTLLLTGSNAFMAAYSAPTRDEINQAHMRRRWLHVGCMSLRNMRRISWKKSIVVSVLAVSSVPFHLLYNSLVFTSLSANNYYWAVVSEDFLSGASFNLTGPSFPTPGGRYFDVDATLPDDTSLGYARLDYADKMAELDGMYRYFSDMQDSSSSWERLDQKSCIQAYSNSFVSTRRNVILVSSSSSSNNSIIQYGSSDIDAALDNNWWICSKLLNDGGYMTCNPQGYLANASSWQVFDQPIEYCLSEQVNATCSIKFSMDIMIVVAAFNALKVVAMLWILFRLDASHLITCAGDACSSFIKRPDQTTLGMCLAARRDVDAYWRQPGARIYDDSRRRRWGQAVSRKRWALFILLMIAAWTFVFGFGAWGFSHTRSRGISLSPSSLWRLGFGTINQNAMAFYGGAGDAVGMSIVANLPQVVLAMIYLMYMSIMTTLFHAVDWSNFAKTPQTLMVSTPTGKQRGTWLLGAPLPYGIGLLALQTLLHWFVSQSLFLVQITIYNKLGQPDTSHPLSNCGYSPIAIIFSMVASGILFLTAVFFMLRRLPPGAPPVVSTCSATISAACHVPGHMVDDGLVYGKLRWGVTVQYPDGVGHCSLAPEDAWEAGFSGMPVCGRAYA